MKKRTIGIILLVLGIMGLFGGFANGSWAKLGQDNIISSVTTVALTAGFIIGGLVLIFTPNKS